MATQIRAGSKRFYDDAKFPRGFHKSGDFTLAEADALTDLGHTLMALESGKLQPESDDEKRFLLVAAGQMPAQNVAEKAWAKYVKLTRMRRSFHTLNSTIRSLDGEDSFSDTTISEED